MDPLNDNIIALLQNSSDPFVGQLWKDLGMFPLTLKIPKLIVFYFIFFSHFFWVGKILFMTIPVNLWFVFHPKRWNERENEWYLNWSFNYVTVYLKQKMLSAWMQHKVRLHLEAKCARECSEQWANCTRWVAENRFLSSAKCCCFFLLFLLCIYRWMFLF